jgi:hypothetical protein
MALNIVRFLLGLAVSAVATSVRSRTSTWNPADKSATVTLSNGNLTAAVDGVTNTGLAGVRSTTTKASGKTYIKFTVPQSNGSSTRVGLANAAYSLVGSSLGINVNSLGYTNTGAVTVNGATIGTAAAYTGGSVIDMVVDITGQLIWFRVDGGNWNNSAGANPNSGAGGFSLATLAAGPYFGALSFTQNQPASYTADFFATAPASSSFFTPWDT